MGDRKPGLVSFPRETNRGGAKNVEAQQCEQPSKPPGSIHRELHPFITIDPLDIHRGPRQHRRSAKNDEHRQLERGQRLEQFQGKADPERLLGAPRLGRGIMMQSLVGESFPAGGERMDGKAHRRSGLPSSYAVSCREGRKLAGWVERNLSPHEKLKPSAAKQ